jgi:pyridoxamine 5'-phosphate oxidase
MSLSTVGPGGQPSSRIVLLKAVDENGFVFFTNYESRKSNELLDKKKAALLFWWPTLGRQVRIEGEVQKTTEEESDVYFSTRPLESRLGAIASHQSQPLESRQALVSKVKELEAIYSEKKTEPPRPPNWGGFRLAPDSIEFWQNGEFRLHDRFLFEKNPSGTWNGKRLYP